MIWTFLRLNLLTGDLLSSSRPLQISENTKCFPHLRESETTVTPEEPWNDADPKIKDPWSFWTWTWPCTVLLSQVFASRFLQGVREPFLSSDLSHPWAVKVVNLSRQRLRFCNPEKQGRHKVYKVTQGVGRVAPSLFTKNKVTETSYLRILWGQNISLLKQVNLNINQKNRPQSFESWSVLIQLGPPHVLTISRHSFNLTLVLPPDFTFHLPINSLWILLLSSSMKHFGGTYYRHSTLLGIKKGSSNWFRSFQLT